jgi:hypothetical protein
MALESSGEPNLKEEEEEEENKTSDRLTVRHRPG